MSQCLGHQNDGIGSTKLQILIQQLRFYRNDILPFYAAAKTALLVSLRKKQLQRKNIALKEQGKRIFLIFADEDLDNPYRRVIETTSKKQLPIPSL